METTFSFKLDDYYTYIFFQTKISFCTYILIYYIVYSVIKVQVAGDDGLKKSLAKRRRLDECTRLVDRAEAIRENFSNLDWVLDKLNNGSVLQVRHVYRPFRFSCGHCTINDIRHTGRIKNWGEGKAVSSSKIHLFTENRLIDCRLTT